MSTGVCPTLVAAVSAAVQGRNPIKLQNGEIAFQCPNGAAHRNGDAHPSCHWNPSKATFICRVCGVKGGAKKLADLLGVPMPARSGQRETGRWTLRDTTGRDVAVHVRLEPGKRGRPKDCIWQQPDGTPELGGRKVKDLPLYGVHELGKRERGSTVILVEGEKCRDALEELGIAAVGTVTGAASIPSDEVLTQLWGYDVVCWPDADQPGREHMGRISTRLKALGIAARVFDPWPDATDGWDAADWTGTPEALRDALAAAPSAGPVSSAPSVEYPAGRREGEHESTRAGDQEQKRKGEEESDSLVPNQSPALPLSCSPSDEVVEDLAKRAVAIARRMAEEDDPRRTEDRQAFYLTLRLQSLPGIEQLDLQQRLDLLHRAAAAYSAVRNVDRDAIFTALVAKWDKIKGGSLAVAVRDAASSPITLLPPVDRFGPLITRCASVAYHLQLEAPDADIWLPTQRLAELLDVPSFQRIAEVLRVLKQFGLLALVAEHTPSRAARYRFQLDRTDLYQPPTAGIDRTTVTRPPAVRSGVSTKGVGLREWSAPADCQQREPGEEG